MNLQELIVPLKLDKTGFDGGIDETIKKIANFAAVAAAITATVAVIKKAIDATMQWADEMDSLQDVMGGTNIEAASLNFVLRKSGVATETLAKGMVILEKGLVKADGTLDTIGISLKEFGINALDANGQVKDQVELIREISDKYNSFATQQERVNFLTEVFGRSGAELIDFFDTMAAEGGIDKVAEKVERLGLAIDPNRYEKFNRNLEELRLVGLGLAVAFTEKLMPVLERFLDWAVDISPEVTKFFDTMRLAFERGGLGNMLGVLDRWLANLIDSVDWAGWGDKFGDMVESALGIGIDGINLPKFAVELGKGIKEFLIAAVGEENLRVFKEHFVDYIRLQLDYVYESVKEWATDVIDTIKKWADDLKDTIDDKLREIAKTFFNRALAWTQQMIRGLENGIGGLLDKIEEIVDEINGILKKIKTHFALTFSVDTTGVEDTVTLPPAPKPPKRPIKPGRASGGAVIAGQSYTVFDTFRPEIFTPNISGRIDTLNFGEREVTLSRKSIDELAERLGIIIPTATVKALNNG